MPYLTYQEYNDLGFTEIENTEFNRLVKHASNVLDGVTRYFYRYNNLEDDVSLRKEQFKKAVAAQIEYFHDKGATSSHEMNEPGTVTIGRTTISRGSRNSTQGAPQASLVSNEVYLYLHGTGLLYRGLGVRS